MIKNEQGSDIIEKHFNESCISSVNATEVVSKLCEYKILPEEIDFMLTHILPTDVVSYTQNMIQKVAALIPFTKPYRLSLGVRVCINLGIMYKIPVIIADQVWKDLDINDLNVIH